MPRRAHRKSRNGCRECKRRHVKVTSLLFIQNITTYHKLANCHHQCDESRPICSNCTTSERVCEYEDRIWVIGQSQRQSRARTRDSLAGELESTTSSPSSSSPTTTTRASKAPNATTDSMMSGRASRAQHASTPPDYHNDNYYSSPVNVSHIKLYHHLITETAPSLSKRIHSDIFPADLMQMCLSTPYLVNQLLALSALHLSTKYRHPSASSSSSSSSSSLLSSLSLSGARSEPCLGPESEFESHRLHQQAAQLQNHALALFNNLPRLEITPETCIPLFLFASILGMHMLCDTLVYRSPHEVTTFDHFLDRFTNYLRLHRGVRSIIDNSWNLIRESALKPLVREGEIRFSTSTSDTLEPPFNQLWERIQCRLQQQHLSSSSLQAESKTYHVTIKMLQLVKNVSNPTKPPLPHPPPPPPPPPSTTDNTDNPNPPADASNISGIFGWPVILPIEFLDLLEKRQPEAIVILAYFAVLLHEHRDYWCFGDGGSFLITGITRYLGEEWKEWLEWPNGFLQGAGSL